MALGRGYVLVVKHGSDRSLLPELASMSTSECTLGRGDRHDMRSIRVQLHEKYDRKRENVLQ
jgi:hypothetical protein